MVLLTVINILIFLSNGFLIGHLGKVVDGLESKLEDMSMLEHRVEHLFDCTDSAFFVPSDIRHSA